MFLQGSQGSEREITAVCRIIRLLDRFDENEAPREYSR